MDCGSRLARTQLAEYLSKNKISVRAVLCSHGHYDHTENNRFLEEEYGAELVMSCLDAGILQDTLSLKTVFYSNTLQDNERECSDMLCKADQMILPVVFLPDGNHNPLISILFLLSHNKEYSFPSNKDNLYFLPPALNVPYTSGLP